MTKKICAIFFSVLFLINFSGCSIDALFRSASSTTIQPNTALKVFEDASAWIPKFGSVENDPITTKSGNQSILLSRSDEGVVDALHKIKIHFGAAPKLRVRVYFHDQPSRIALLFSSSPDIDAFFIARIGVHEKALHLGWNTIDIYPDAWEKYGDIDWSKLMTGLRIRIEPEGGQIPPRVSWDSIVVNAPGVPGVLITFDDGYASTYSKAYQYMQSIQALGTVYVIPDRIGNIPKYLTLEQIKEMDAQGWSIANHSYTHEKQFIYLSPDEIITQLSEAKNVLDGWGLTRASAHVAYPWGNWDTVVLDAMESAGMLTGRTTDYMQHVVWSHEGRNYLIGTRMVEHFNSLEDVKAWVDEAAAYGRIVGLCFHDIVDAEADSYQWKIEDFIALMDYIHEKELPFLTINDYYALAVTNMLPVDDVYHTIGDEELVVASPGVTENDYFSEIVDYRVVIGLQSGPEKGQLDINQDGSFKYTPPSGWAGIFDFQYRLCMDDLCTEPASVRIDVLKP